MEDEEIEHNWNARRKKRKKQILFYCMYHFALLQQVVVGVAIFGRRFLLFLQHCIRPIRLDN